MRYFILLITLFSTLVFGEVQNLFISQQLIDSKIKIIDIRTQDEWKMTGMIKNSIPIEFFDKRGGYNVQNFMKKFQAQVKPDEKVALICNTGSRTRLVAEFLSKHYHYNVIDLQGGIQYAIGKKIPLVPYQP